MIGYTPQAGSVPARLIAHLQIHGGSIDRSDIAALLQIHRKNVDNNLATAVTHGLLVRDGATYCLAGDRVDSTAGSDLHTIWGGASKPAFPSAPPRADDPPVRKMRTPKQVAAEVHAGRAALAIVPATPTGAVVAPTPESASLRQVGGTHYKQMTVQPWDVVDDWPLAQRIGYYRGNALKYLMRMGSKDHDAQEIAKGRHYVEKLLEVLQEQDVQVAAT